MFPVRNGFGRKDDPVFARYYEKFDDNLCRLVERLQGSGYQNRLDVAFRTWEVPDDGETGFKEFLPKFRERGRVMFLQEWSDEVVYHSD